MLLLHVACDLAALSVAFHAAGDAVAAYICAFTGGVLLLKAGKEMGHG